MKKIASLLLALSLVFSVLLALPLNVSAANTETQDGLEVTITTDKTEYTADEDIQVSVNVINNNSYKVEDVSIETLLPDGLLLKSGNLSTIDIDIEAGASYSTFIVAKLSENLKDSEETKPDNTTKPDDTTKPGGNNQETNSPQTSDNPSIVLWVVLLIASAVGIALAFKFKKTAKMMSLFLCFAMILTMLPISALAAEQSKSSMYVEKAIKVNKINMVIKAVVKYNMNTNKPITEAEEYYRENSEKIVSVDAVDENNVFSEKEVYLLMEERGFTQYPVTYEYNFDGNYIGEGNVSKNSNTKHPMYQTLYVTRNGDVWSIFVIGKTIIANPAFYNAKLDGELQMLIAEAPTLTSYDDVSNLFYITIPKDSVIELMEIDKISAEKIEKITFKEVE